MKRMRTSGVNRFGFVDLIIYMVITLLAVAMIYPFVYVVAGSFMGPGEFYRTKIILFPTQPTLMNYEYLFVSMPFAKYLYNTLFITVTGTLLSLFLTSMMAYGLSRKFPGVKVLVVLVTATMFLYPGLIPTYMNYRNLGLINSRLLLLLSIMIIPYYLIVMRSNYLMFPEELIEAARVDGYSEMQTYFRIILPLSKTTLAAIGLFIAVDYWNMFLQSVFFISSPEKKMIQDYLSQLIMSIQLGVDAANTTNRPPSDVIKMTAITASLLPILALYPFLQKHFVKGALVGSVKG